ncbi:MAG TPA: hypothetical protein VEG34_06850 [Thermoanaerobaculia bacterium]|nr:hypothetical protein [Thermoanaerobaculia bacterium]
MSEPLRSRTLRDLVRGIVLAQGNIFIKGLLRTKGIKIGATKADFERNLLEAVDSGQITLADVETWLEEVEGWGDQHIYLFDVPDTIAKHPIWRTIEGVRRRVEKAELGDRWNAQTSLAFPGVQTLTGIFFDGTSLRLVWHKGAERWVRDPSKDYETEIEGERYRFQAYRYRADRAVTRFELRIGKSPVAALFVPIAVNLPEHKDVIAAARETLDKLVEGVEELWRKSVAVGNVIKRLDQERIAPQQGGPRVQTHSTRLVGGGAYVEFASLSGSDDYTQSAPVREVRLAIQPKQLGKFEGATGSFEMLKDDRLSRDVRVQLYGKEKRIRIWKQLAADEVWEILGLLRRFA